MMDIKNEKIDSLTQIYEHLNTELPFQLHVSIVP